MPAPTSVAFPSASSGCWRSRRRSGRRTIPTALSRRMPAGSPRTCSPLLNSSGQLSTDQAYRGKAHAPNYIAVQHGSIHITTLAATASFLPAFLRVLPCFSRPFVSCSIFPLHHHTQTTTAYTGPPPPLPSPPTCTIPPLPSSLPPSLLLPPAAGLSCPASWAAARRSCRGSRPLPQTQP